MNKIKKPPQLKPTLKQKRVDVGTGRAHSWVENT